MISTDRPYTETDPPNPRSIYAASKLLGDWFAADAPRHYVLRVESLFGGPAARNGARRGSLGVLVNLVTSSAQCCRYFPRALVHRPVRRRERQHLADCLQGECDADQGHHDQRLRRRAEGRTIKWRREFDGQRARRFGPERRSGSSRLRKNAHSGRTWLFRLSGWAGYGRAIFE